MNATEWLLLAARLLILTGLSIVSAKVVHDLYRRRKDRS